MITMLLGKTMIFNLKKKNHQLSMATNPKVYKDQPFHSFQVYKIPHPVKKFVVCPNCALYFGQISIIPFYTPL